MAIGYAIVEHRNFGHAPLPLLVESEGGIIFFYFFMLLLKERLII